MLRILTTLLGFAGSVSLVGCSKVAPSTIATPDFHRTPVAATHPVIGAWRYEYPASGCIEQFEFRVDGTRISVSGDEQLMTEFEIREVADFVGFFRWKDRVITSNRRRDCSGSIVPVGDVATGYLHVNATGDSMDLCSLPAIEACFATFRRVRPGRG